MSSPDSASQLALLDLKGLTKSFAGVVALKPLDLKINAGQILGLVGENGAGKSTLIKLLSGIYQPDDGEILWQGSSVQFFEPGQALDTGIATIHQELEYAAHLTVAENMLLGEEWPRHGWGGIHWKELHRIAQERLTSFGIDIPTTAHFESLAAVQKQEVAIANALARNAKLLILDEPSAALTEPEIERLFSHLNRLRKNGVAMIYVSHRLDEIFKLTDQVAILRDGSLIDLKPTSELTAEKMVSQMVGRELDQFFPHQHDRQFGDRVLELASVTRAGMFHDIDLHVRAGEIVGLAGLVGAGRSELARAIYGLYPIESGTMKLNGQPWSPKQPRDSLNAGLVYIPEERKRQALVLDHDLKESISIGFTDILARMGFIPQQEENNRVASIIGAYDVRASGTTQQVGTLSGGNQQKAILGRWLQRNPQVILLDEPTRGVDVGAKAQIHASVEELAKQGKGVLLISSDLPEVISMSDRVYVMNHGTLEAELTGEQLTEHNVIMAASGLSQPTEGAT